MSSYREAHEIGKKEYESIEGAARAMMGNLGLEADRPANATVLAQARILATALELFIERNAITPDAWKSAGYLGNLLNASGKMTRLMANLWYRVGGNGRTEKPIDNAFDGITYLAFFIRQYEEGNERGYQPGTAPQ